MVLINSIYRTVDQRQNLATDVKSRREICHRPSEMPTSILPTKESPRLTAELRVGLCVANKTPGERVQKLIQRKLAQLAMGRRPLGEANTKPDEVVRSRHVSFK